ncbi:MAG: phage holin family protein [Deltaproteobacteria bacterium]|nr:MAG: phage holin family protein [Deltaproteobacteria bacterium]
MKGILLRWLILTLAILAAAYVLKGIDVTGFVPALAAAAILGILNAFVRPLLLLLTLPLNVLSLGLFTFVINGFLLKIVSLIIEGFTVQGFWAALFGSLFISLVSALLSLFVREDGKVGVVQLRRNRDGNWE